MRHWAESYVGIPYAEFDCAELCVKVCREQFGYEINLPANRAPTLIGISKQITTLKDDFGERTDSPIEGDGVLMLGKGRINHIGVVCYIDDQLHVLHAMRSAKMAVLHDELALKNLGFCVEGYYKWK